MTVFVFYNGVNLELENVELWECRAVMSDDGIDHLYNHYKVGCRCVFNPGASVPGYTPTGAGSPGPSSWQQLHQLLSQPRQPLTVQFNGVVVLQSPLPTRGSQLQSGAAPPPPALPSPGAPPTPPGGSLPFGGVSLPFPPAPSPPLNLVQNPVVPPPLGPLAQLHRCDARGGPVPTNVQVREVHGTKTMLVYFEVETWLPYQSPDGSAASVLSHRWEMSHDINEQHMTTRTVEGSAVFRNDLLYDQPGAAQRVPDDFRLRLLHPVPPNCKREGIQVLAASDCCSVRYRFSDVEQSVNLGLKNPVVKFEGYYKTGYDNTGFLLSPASRYVNLVVRCWGRNTTTRQQLINACVSASQRFGFTGGGGGGLLAKASIYYKADLTVMLHERFAELVVGAYVDGWASYIKNGGFDTAFNVSRNLAGAGFPEDVAPRVLGAGEDPAKPTSPLPTDNPRPPAGGGRGTYLGRLVAEQLSAEWATPAPPPNPEPQAVDFSF